MFKKIGLTVLILGLMVGVGYACTGNDCNLDSNVQDTNDGNKGYIFVYDCEKGNNSLGKWVDPSTVPALKGDTGATGATGSQGVAGQDGYTPIKGVDYFDGENGLQGPQGLQGERGEIGLTGSQGEVGVSGNDGIDGLNGTDGQKGDTGSQGEQGQAGVDGENGKTPTKGVDYNDGKDGEKGKTGSQGQQGIQGPQGKGLEDRVELIGEVRVLDTKRTTWSIYAGRDVNNGVGIYGAKVTVKLGRSYEERRLDELEAKLNMVQPTVQENVTVVPTATGFRVQVIK